MFIPDLTQFPVDHPPSPYNHPVIHRRDGVWGIVQLPPNTHLYAVGWLDNCVPVTGQIPDECITALFIANVHNTIISDGTLGWHDCELCSKNGPVIHWQDQQHPLRGQGHHLVRIENSVYMCPELILHYILDHNYKPPDEFLKALIHGSFLTYDDLIWLAEDPWRQTNRQGSE
jgi:hypothetical protein